MYSRRRNSRGKRSISRSPRRALDEIDFQRPHPQRRLTGVCRATKEGFYSCNEFDDCKGLRKIVVSAAS